MTQADHTQTPAAMNRGSSKRETKRDQLVKLLRRKAGADVPRLDEHFRANRIIARSVAGYGLPDYLRITIGTAEEMDRVIAALTSFERSEA